MCDYSVSSPRSSVGSCLFWQTHHSVSVSYQTLPFCPPVLLVQGRWLVQSIWKMEGAKLTIFLLHPNTPSPVELMTPVYS